MRDRQDLLIADTSLDIYGSLDAADYEATRPGYPAQAISAILAGNPASIADIGAGTGRFAMAAAQASEATTVFAVEPSEQMRSAWSDVPANVKLQGGTGEDTGLAPASIDRVVWAQSFHWLDAAAAGPETRRILSEGGCGFVLVNQLDVSVSWVHRLSRIMRSGDVARGDKPPALPGFYTEQPSVWEWEQALRAGDLLGLARTRSSYLRSAPHVQARMQRNLAWYLTDFLGFEPHNPVRLPYLTYLWRLVPEPA